MALVSAPVETQSVTCALCKETKEQEICITYKQADGNRAAVYRCKHCHAMLKRMNNLFYEEPDLKEVWSGWDKKAEFFDANHRLHGADLRAAIEQLTTLEKTQTRSANDSSEAHWMDLIDLRQKFKDKPNQLAALERNAPQCYHTTRECTLYRVDEFKTCTTASEQTSLKHTLSIKTESIRKTAKAAPKPKGKPLTNAGEEGAPEDAMKPLNDKQKAALQKIRNDVTAKRDVVVNYQNLCKADKVKDFIPTYINQKIALVLGGAEMFEADAALAASEMQCANFNVLMQTGKDSKVLLINACKPIHVQLEVACSEASLLLKKNKETGVFLLEPKSDEA